MEKKVRVEALCSGMFGIGTGRMLVTYDDQKPVSEFFDNSRHAMFLNYTAILHWKGIDGFEPSKCIFVHEIQKQERLVRMVMKSMLERHTFIDYRNTLKWSMENDAEKFLCENPGYYDERIITDKVKTHKYEGEWRISGWTMDRINETIRYHENVVNGVYRTLEALGVDVDDREAQKQILTNLGFYRV